MSEFLHNDENDNIDAKAIAIPWVFSKNNQAKNEKILVSSIFSFSPNVLYSCQNIFRYFSHIVICICFQLGPIKNFLLE